MKKFVSVLCMLLACLSALCWAAGEEEALPEPVKITCVPGESMAFSLKLTAEAAGMQATIVWDPAQLELVGDPLAYAPDFKKGSMIAMINPEPEAGTVTLVYIRQKNLIAEAMEILPLTFRVREEAIPGETAITICELQMVDAQNTGLECIGEGVLLEITPPEGTPVPEATPVPTPSPEVTATPDPTATPVPETTAEPAEPARLYLELILPEEPEATAAPTAESTVTPTLEPTAEPTVTPTLEPTEEPTVPPTLEPTAEPTATPTAVPTATRPGGHIGGGSTVTATPTPKPTATPAPTIPTVEIGSEQPTKEPVSGAAAGITMQARRIAGGVIVELFADDTVIGGLQAEIRYDAAQATLVNAAFSDAFTDNAMIQMINTRQPGKISLVYSNLAGYAADGSAIFTAQFHCGAVDSLRFSMADAKYTGTVIGNAAVTIAEQQVVCRIQPMNDLVIIGEDGVRIIEVTEGESFSLTVDPGDIFALRVQGREIQHVRWTADRAEIMSVSAQGLCEAKQSGLISLTARSTTDDRLLAEGRICVRNAQFGLPVEILNISIGDEAGEMFALSAEVDEAVYAARGIELTFCDNGMTVRITGLLPEDMYAVPASVFDLCGNLTEIDVTAGNILTIESEAFLRCDSLERITLRSRNVEIQPSALPEHGNCVLAVTEDSSAAEWAVQHGVAVQILERAGGEQ